MDRAIAGPPVGGRDAIRRAPGTATEQDFPRRHIEAQGDGRRSEGGHLDTSDLTELFCSP